MSNILDAILVGFLLLVFGIMTLIGLMVFTALSDSGFLGTYATSLKGFYTSLNNMAIFIAITVALVPVFAALMIRTHPIFFIISLILVVVQFIMMPTFVQVYNGVAQGMPVAVQNDMAAQSNIMQMLPILSAIGAGLAIVAGLVRE